MTRIRYALLEDGGFVAECLNTGVTAYAYPGSIYANSSHQFNAANIARLMIDNEDGKTRTADVVVKYDARNRARLDAAGDAVKVIDEEVL